MSNYGARDYRVEIQTLSKVDGGGYIAYIGAFDSYGDGETAEKAMAEVYSVVDDIITLALEDGKRLPQPKMYKDEEEYSGKLTIRIPKTLHKRLAETASKEKVSLNQLLLSYVSYGYGINENLQSVDCLSVAEKNKAKGCY